MRTLVEAENRLFSPGPYSWLLERLFPKVRFPEDSKKQLIEAHHEASIVYTFRSKRHVDPRCLLYLLRQNQLPLPSWLHDSNFQSLSDTRGLTANAVAQRSSILYLRRPRTLTSGRDTTSKDYSGTHVEDLLEQQKNLDRPILLVPVGLQWTQKPMSLQRSFVDAVFGDLEAPGVYREFVGFLWRYREAHFHVGAPVNLKEVLERFPKLSTPKIAKTVRWTILHHLAREDALRVGPIYRSAERTRQSVKRDPQLRLLVNNLSEQGKRPEQLETRIDRILKKMAADMRYGWLRFFDTCIEFVWNRIYDGIQVDKDGLSDLRAAARKGPLIVVPSHKSHIDYLVLSQVFFQNGLNPPHIAAGENLNFWPMGPIFRRCGAFFIRRSFRGDKLYATVFAAYLRRLMKEGHSIEFFIEGGRSRTGKLLAPKMGMLSLCADPVLDGRLSEAFFLPVSISYEKVIEARAYASELAGAKKEKEGFRSLLRSARVLTSRYGRVYVDFGKPISTRAFSEERNYLLPLRADQPSLKKKLVQQLGYQIVYGINRATRATTTSVAAIVLLSQTRIGMGEDELHSRAYRAMVRLKELGARLSESLTEPSTSKEAIAATLDRFVREKLISREMAPDGATIYQLSNPGRVALEYYRNNILHFFLPTAVVASAILVGGGVEAEVRTWSQTISRILKSEFTFQMRPEGDGSQGSFDLNYSDTLERLSSWKIIEVQDNRVVVHNPGELQELSSCLAVFFETYEHLGSTFRELLASGKVSERKLLETALVKAKRKALDGTLRRAEGASQPMMKQALAMYRAEGALVNDANNYLVSDHDGNLSRVSSTLRTLNEVVG